MRLTISLVALLLTTTAALAQQAPSPTPPAKPADAPAAMPAPTVPQSGMGNGVVGADKAVSEAEAPRIADEDAGAYLAAAYAASQSDFRAAAGYFDRALAADPGNAQMQESALLALVALGQMDEAITRAEAMKAEGASHMIGHLLGMARAAKAGDYAAVIAALDEAAARAPGHAAPPVPAPLPVPVPTPAPAPDSAAPGSPPAPPADGGVMPPLPSPTETAPDTAAEAPDEGVDLIGDLVRAWAQVGQGQMSEAIKGFDKVMAVPGAAPFGRYHKALALASVGDFEGADALFKGEPGTEMRLTRRGVQAHVQILSQLERRDEALKMLDEALKGEADPVLDALRSRVAAGEAIPFDTIANPTDGIAEVYYNFASAMLGGELPDASTLVYARMAAWLSPGNLDAQLLSAGLLEQMEQFDLAVEAYDAVPAEATVRPVADLGRANALRRLGRRDEAIDTVRGLTKSQPRLIPAWMALGDMLRQDDKFAEAVPVYDTVIKLADEQLGGADWFAYYARGVAHERSKQWPKAEADFRKALELSPDQPEVLNYLGYSYVDRNQNLDEALKLIQAAVTASPEDGYIQDSLGWAYFRMGRYEDAVAPMELAVARMAEDPLVNDHLGDVYWAVGRQREARVQWQRALSMMPEEGQPDSGEVDPDRIRRKIEVGLDQVLADEGAKPLHADK